MRWVLDDGSGAVGTVCMDCFEEETAERFDTRMPVVAARKAKKGTCSCGEPARGGVRITLAHSLFEAEERFLCVGCVTRMTGVRVRLENS